MSNSPIFEERSEIDHVFATNKEIFFKTDLKSGVAETFYLEINGNNETGESLPLSSTIPWVRIKPPKHFSFSSF